MAGSDPIAYSAFLSGQKNLESLNLANTGLCISDLDDTWESLLPRSSELVYFNLAGNCEDKDIGGLHTYMHTYIHSIFSQYWTVHQ